MKNAIKFSVIAALMALSAQASAQSVLLNFDYIAQANTSSTLTPGASVASLGGQSAGWLKITDLSDLGLGSGVRVQAQLQNLTQFGNYGANTLELNFLGTGARVNGGDEYVTSAGSFTNVSNNFSMTTGGDGGIEWDEHGSVGNGTVNSATSHKWAFFQQQFNTVLGSWTNGETITFDLKNGETLSGGTNAGQAYTGFSVADFLANPVQNQDGNQPAAYAWLRLQPIAGTSGIPTDTSAWYRPFMSATNGRLNFLATSVTAVPEAETYSMLLAGLGMMGAIVRRRKST